MFIRVCVYVCIYMHARMVNTCIQVIHLYVCTCAWRYAIRNKYVSEQEFIDISVYVKKNMYDYIYPRPEERLSPKPSSLPLTILPFYVVIQTGKLQPVLIWREKPVLLALLSNLGIPVPASNPVFRTKWGEIS